MPRIPLIEDLARSSLPPGSNLLVEFDAASHWYAAALNIAVGWLKSGGQVVYQVFTQPLTSIRQQFTRLGADPAAFEKNGKLELWDWYTCTLGQKSNEKNAVESLKVADISLMFAKFLKSVSAPETPPPEVLSIADNYSSFARFNDEKVWVEFMLTRNIPMARRFGSSIDAVVVGIHSEWLYKNLEAGYDAVIDFKLEEVGDTTRDLMRIRTMRVAGYDRKWHELMVTDNFEVTLA